MSLLTSVAAVAFWLLRMSYAGTLEKMEKQDDRISHLASAIHDVERVQARLDENRGEVVRWMEKLDKRMDAMELDIRAIRGLASGGSS